MVNLRNHIFTIEDRDIWTLMVLIGLCGLCTGCADTPSSATAPPTTETCEPQPLPRIETDVPVDDCFVPSNAPLQGLLLTTTDFATGSYCLLDLNALNDTVNGEVYTPEDIQASLTCDIANASTDAIGIQSADLLFNLHRHRFNYIDLLSPSDGAIVDQVPLFFEDSSNPNPQDIAVLSDGRWVISALDSAYLQVFEPNEQNTSFIDLREFADEDCQPEPAHLFECGNTLWVNMQRLSPSFQRTTTDILVPINIEEGAYYDRVIELLGGSLSSLHPHPHKPGFLLALTSGLEEIELATGQSRWLIEDTVFAMQNIGAWHLTDLRPDPTRPWVYLAIASPDFRSVDVIVWDLQNSQELARIEGHTMVERSLGVSENYLWIGSTQYEAPGLYVYDTRSLPPTRIAGPITTGLAPYNMIEIR